MMLSFTCSVCGWPGLEEDQRSVAGGASEEICVCCGFQSGYSDDNLGVPIEEWRRRWLVSGMRFRWRDDGLPPAHWDPKAQLETLLTYEAPAIPDLPDNPALREALMQGDANAVARTLAVGTVIIALDGPSVTDDAVVLIRTPNNDTRMPVFTGPASWQAWAAEPNRPGGTATVRGPELLHVAQRLDVDWLVLDAAGHAAMALPVDPPSAPSSTPAPSR